MGYKGLRGVTKGNIGLKKVKRVKGSYKGLQGVTRG